MPIERLRMRPWLENALNEHKFPGVEWVDEGRKIFRLPWKHASRNGWDVEKDASLFQAWAVHTGKYKGDGNPNPKTWKANFRCALNSLPDMEELVDRRSTKGNNAFKMYRIVGDVEKKGYTTKRLKARGQRKKRLLSRARSGRKDLETQKNDTVNFDTELAQSYARSPKAEISTDYAECEVPQSSNGTHLVDHDYAVTRYFDIFNESTNEVDMDQVFNVPDSEIVKTEPFSPKELRGDDDFSLYEESRVDSKNIKTSFEKTDHKRIMSDDEVVELLDEMSSECDSPRSSAEAAIDDIFDARCIDSFETDFSDEIKPRANSAPAVLETAFDPLTIFTSPSKIPRSNSTTSIQKILSTTSQELLQSCLA